MAVRSVESLAFSPDGRTLAAGWHGGFVSLWNVTHPDDVKPAKAPLDLDCPDVVSHSVEFSPDGHTLAAGSTDSKVRLWKVADPGHPTPLGKSLTGPAQPVMSVAFSPDGHTLAATTDDGVATLWDLKVETAISRICAGSSGALSRHQWSRYVPELPYDPPCVTT
ncbi:WD40 repeat domain-containing protein [Streptomyces sp. NPDC058316]|uniref:WD40 repeat domain-containing protein n=1 Tax=unclassified Streptomyces TaxID=2593676 RepID=UPI00331A8C51